MNSLNLFGYAVLMGMLGSAHAQDISTPSTPVYVTPEDATSLQPNTFFVSPLPLDREGWADQPEGKTRIYCERVTDFSDLRQLIRHVPSPWKGIPTNLQRCDVTRFSAKTGQSINVVYVRRPQNGQCGTVKVDLSKTGERVTVIDAQMGKVIEFASAMIFPPSSRPASEFKFSAESEKRICKVEGKSQPLKYDMIAGDIEITLNNDSTVKVPVATGENEHYFWTIDVAFPGARNLKYDPTMKHFVSASDKPDALLGINWAVGDILTDFPLVSLNRVVLKASVQNKKLGGVGIGYRLNSGDSDHFLSKAVISVFAMHFWHKNDVGMEEIPSERWEKSVRAGVSFGVGF